MWERVRENEISMAPGLEVTPMEATFGVSLPGIVGSNVNLARRNKLGLSEPFQCYMLLSWQELSLSHWARVEVLQEDGHSHHFLIPILTRGSVDSHVTFIIQ